MALFQIWMESYAATGESSGAMLIGEAEGETFDEACLNYRDEKGEPMKLDRNGDEYRRGSYRGQAEPGVNRATLKGNYSIWACQLFPTEQEARKAFG